MERSFCRRLLPPPPEGCAQAGTELSAGTQPPWVIFHQSSSLAQSCVTQCISKLLWALLLCCRKFRLPHYCDKTHDLLVEPPGHTMPSAHPELPKHCHSMSLSEVCKELMSWIQGLEKSFPLCEQFLPCHACGGWQACSGPLLLCLGVP